MDSVSRSTPLSRRSQVGFSMVEVLVSIIVLSFGLLGMVGLQAAALKGNREARLQSVAAEFSREMGEMMRSNKGQGTGLTAADNGYLVCPSGVTCGGTTTNTANYCLNMGSGCSTNLDVAQAQTTEWLARVNADLPGARVVVCRDSAPYDSGGLPIWDCTNGGDIFVIKIGWTRGSINRAATAASAIERVTDSGSRPGVVYPVTAGI